MPESNLSKMIETALENLKKMTDTNTVVGEPIKVSGGTTVIPVSKVSVGFASGGMDYQSKSAPDKAPNFGGGTGSGFTITPIAFLTVDEIGTVSLLNLGTASEGKDTFGKIGEILEKAPSTIEKIAKMFKKDKETPGDGEAEAPLEAAPENGGE